MAIGIEGVGEAVTGGMLADAVEPRPARRRPAPKQLPQLRRGARRGLLPPMRAEGPRPPHHPRFPARISPRRGPFRRQDLAHRAAARVAAGRPHPPLYRGRAGAVRLAFGPVPVLGLPDVRDLQPGSAARSASATARRTRRRGPTSSRGAARPGPDPAGRGGAARGGGGGAADRGDRCPARRSAPGPGRAHDRRALRRRDDAGRVEAGA